MKNKTKSFSHQNKPLNGFKTNFDLGRWRNYWNLKQNYFRLTTKKITLMGIILSLNIVLTLFSRYVLGLVPILGFFVMEVSFISVLMFATINNFFYTVIFLEVTVWFRLILASEPIGLLAMNLTDGFFLTLYCLINYLSKKLANNWDFHHGFKKMFILEAFSGFLLVLFTSAMALVFNYILIFPLYFPWWNSSEVLLLFPALFGLNIAKYTLNFLVYLMILKTLLILASRYEN